MLPFADSTVFVFPRRRGRLRLNEVGFRCAGDEAGCGGAQVPGQDSVANPEASLKILRFLRYALHVRRGWRIVAERVEELAHGRLRIFDLEPGTVGGVPDPAGEPAGGRGAVDEGAEAHALDDAAHADGDADHPSTTSRASMPTPVAPSSSPSVEPQIEQSSTWCSGA